jgi:hypothetical protein
VLMRLSYVALTAGMVGITVITLYTSRASRPVPCR